MGTKSFRLFVLVACMLAFSTVLPGPVGKCAAADQNVLKFGSMVPLAFKEGTEIKKWNDLFAKMVNEKGGLDVGGKKYQVQFFVYDVAYFDSAKTLSAVQKAIHQDGVKYLINSFGEVYNLAVVHADQNKVLEIGIGFGNETVGTKYQYFFRPLGGYYTAASNYLIMRDFVKKGAKTGIVCTTDNEMGHVVAKQYGDADAMAGLKMLQPVFFGMDTVDYGPIATKIKSLNVDVVDYGAAAGDQVVSLTAALKDAGWKGFIFPGAGINPTTFANIIKRVGSYFDGAEMFYTDPRGIPVVMKDPEMKELVDRYQKEYGEFRTEGCLWLSGWFAVKQAMAATKSVDPTVLKDYLGKSPKAILTLTGYCQLYARPDIGQVRTTDGGPGNGIGVVKNGKLEYVLQKTTKDEYIATIKVHKLQDVYKKHWEKYGKPTFPNEPSSLDFSDLDKP